MSGLEYGFASHQQVCACNILLQVLFNSCQEPLLASSRENLCLKCLETLVIVGVLAGRHLRPEEVVCV